MVKNPPAMRETWVRFLGWEDPLEEGMATHSSILAWRIPIDREAGQVIVHGVAKSWTHLRSLSRHIYRLNNRTENVVTLLLLVNSFVLSLIHLPDFSQSSSSY